MLPAPHHRKWGWLVWTIILLGLLLGTIWFLRGCKVTPPPVAHAEAPQAYYGTFEPLAGGPSYTGTPAYQNNASSMAMESYHRTMPDGRIFFVGGWQTNSIQVTANTKASQSILQIFTFDPKTNQFQISPINIVQPADTIPSLSYLLTQAGQFAVFSLDVDTQVSTAGNGLSPTGLGARNPKLTLYDTATGAKTEILPTGEDFSKEMFAYKPYIFEVDGGLLIVGREYTEYTGYRATKWQAVTFFYDYNTKQLTKKVGSVGLPDNDSSSGRPVVPLTNTKALIVDNTNLYLFDYKTQTASFKRRLTAYQQDSILSARLIPNTSLVYIIASRSAAKTTTAYSVIYLYNFETNTLSSYRLGEKPLEMGKADNVSSALQGDIPREGTTDTSTQPVNLVPDQTKQYWLQPLLDGTTLVTSDHYYNLPWSYGVMGTLDNQWLSRANSADAAATDPANNYAETITTTMPDITTATTYGSTIQDSILLPDGRVLFAGLLWFIYTPDSSKTAFQSANATTLSNQLGQVGHWADGGKLLIDKTDQDLINSQDPTLIDSDYSNFAGTPYPLKDGRVFFYRPQPTTNIIGQLYDPRSGKSHWVQSNIIKQFGAGSVPTGQGVMDATGNLHFLGFPNDQEMIFYPGSGKAKLRQLKPLQAADAYSHTLEGISTAVGNYIFFFSTAMTGNVGVLNVKTGQYYNLANKLENDWIKKHPTAKVGQDTYQQITGGLPSFDGTSCVVANPDNGMILPGTVGSLLIPGTTNVSCGIEAALSLGNNRILLASGSQLKIFNYKTLKSDALPDLKNFISTHKLFRMSDGRVAIVGEASIPTGKTLRSGDAETEYTPAIEVLDIAKSTVTDPIVDPHFPIQTTHDIYYSAWMLPNDRLLFASQLGTRLSLYDLQNQRWLTQSEALTNLGYDRSYVMMQLPTQPTLIKLATKLSYTDYTKDIPIIGDTIRNNSVVLAAGAVELYIPEAGPWGYYDTSAPRFNWWLWFLTLQLAQALLGTAAIVTKTIRRKYIVPL